MTPWQDPDAPLIDRLRSAAADEWAVPVSVSVALMREAADKLEEHTP